MTNAEMIARLRKADEYEPLGHDGWEAADRIEALISENKRLGQQCEGLMQAGMNNGQALIIAENKLAKAVEAAEQLASDAVPCVCNYCLEARATIAEIKGGSHE